MTEPCAQSSSQRGDGQTSRWRNRHWLQTAVCWWILVCLSCSWKEHSVGISKHRQVLAADTASKLTWVLSTPASVTLGLLSSEIWKLSWIRGCWDDLAGKRTGYWNWWLDFNPWDPYIVEEENQFSHVICPLHMWYGRNAGIHTERQGQDFYSTYWSQRNKQT